MRLRIQVAFLLLFFSFFLSGQLISTSSPSIKIPDASTLKSRFREKGYESIIESFDFSALSDKEMEILSAAKVFKENLPDSLRPNWLDLFEIITEDYPQEFAQLKQSVMQAVFAMIGRE